MKKIIFSGIIFLLIWFCGAIAVLAYMDNNMILSIIALSISTISLPLMQIHE